MALRAHPKGAGQRIDLTPCGMAHREIKPTRQEFTLNTDSNLSLSTSGASPVAVGARNGSG
jgi:hypothetical protein